MKKFLAFTIAILMCFIALSGCSGEEKELTFHDLLKSEYYSIAKCFKPTSLQDAINGVDGETVEKHLSNIAELSKNTTYTEEERKTAYVFYCFFKQRYRLERADCEIGFAPQSFQNSFITVEHLMIQYITSSKNTVTDEGLQLAINLEKMCDEYISSLGK